MLRRMLLSKIHRAVVTQTDVNYVGSITIDGNLIDRIGLLEFEKVEIFDINNGNRFETYVIRGEEGSGVIGINGAAALLTSPGDRVIIVSYGLFTPEEIVGHLPKVIVLDDNNRIIDTKGC